MSAKYVKIRRKNPGFASFRVFGGLSSGFTLIELLVVIAIIGILITMLLAGVSTVQNAARQKKARVFEQALVNAIKAYRNDNDAWPGQIDGNDFCNINVRKMLGDASCCGLTNNPRNINYIEIPPGVLMGASLLDSWKQPYVVAMDYDGDGVVTFNGTCGGSVINFNNVTVTDTVAVVSGGSSPGSSSSWVCSWK